MGRRGGLDGREFVVPSSAWLGHKAKKHSKDSFKRLIPEVEDRNAYDIKIVSCANLPKMV